MECTVSHENGIVEIWKDVCFHCDLRVFKNVQKHLFWGVFKQAETLHIFLKKHSDFN